MERQRRSILIVGHIAVLRCIYAYFMGVPLENIPTHEFLIHRVYDLTPGPFGCTCQIIEPHLDDTAGSGVGLALTGTSDS